MAVLAVMPITVFWILDAYFRAQEGAYRALYKIAAEDLSSSEDRNLALDAFDHFGIRAWLKAIPSLTLLLFYGTLLATTSIAHLTLDAN